MSTPASRPWPTTRPVGGLHRRGGFRIVNATASSSPIFKLIFYGYLVISY